MEIFQKAFNARIASPPDEVLKYARSLEEKNTSVQHTEHEDGYSVEIKRSFLFVEHYMRFRIWQTDENIKFSQISGLVSANMRWYSFSLPGFLLLLMPCCACITILFFPQQLRFIGYEHINGNLEPQFQEMNFPWRPFWGLVALLALFLLIIFLQIVLAIMLRDRYIRELFVQFDYEDTLVKEKAKRG
jgi:hypothetical protein